MGTVLTEVNGFTPIIDAVVSDVGLMTAVVFGTVWRYCQMESGTCTASLETIAERVGISRKTAERHVKILCDKGYLKDTTPGRRNSPHVYKDTGKAQLVGSFSGKTESLTTTAEVRQRVLAGKTESTTRSDRESHPGKTESLLKIPSKIPLEETHEDILAVPQKIQAIQSLTVDAIKKKKLKASEWEQLLAFEESQKKPRKGLIDFINRKLANGDLSPEQSQYLALFGATRFSNPTQARTVQEAITAHGLPLVIEVGTWAANKGFSVADSVSRLGSAIQTWKKPPTTNASTAGGRIFT